jgi:hypothetical protein
MSNKLFIAVIFALAPFGAFAQSTPNFSYGQVPTAGQWNAAFASKQDRLMFTPLSQAGGTLTGKLQTAPSTVNGAGLAVLPGISPSAPANGDIWVTDTGFFVRVNGQTATLPTIGTTAGTVAAGNDSRIVNAAQSGSAASFASLTLGTPLPFAQGGCGATSALGCLGNLGLSGGTSGYVLTSNGTGAAPTYQPTSPGSGALRYDAAQSLSASQIAQALANLAIDGSETTVASAATTDIGSAATQFVQITGTTTITSFGTATKRVRFIRFAGSLTLTHNATSLILPGGNSIVTQAGDSALAVSDVSGNWRVLQYAAGADTAATVTFTPTLSVTSGALTNASATGRYRRIGQKLVWVEYNINIANNGTGAGAVSASLPFIAGGDSAVLAGRENNSTGKMLQGYIGTGLSVVTISNYDNSYPGASGNRLFVSGIYEAP